MADEQDRDDGRRWGVRHRGGVLLLAALFLTVGAYLAGLSYCVSTHGLRGYGLNRGYPTSHLPNRFFRVVYDPAILGIVRYYRWRGNPGWGDDPWDIRLLNRFLFARFWHVFGCSHSDPADCRP
jgi:hypothetical protein